MTSKKAAKGKGRESLHLSYSNSPLLEDHKKRSSPKGSLRRNVFKSFTFHHGESPSYSIATCVPCMILLASMYMTREKGSWQRRES